MKYIMPLIFLVLFSCNRAKEKEEIAMPQGEVFCDADFDVFFKKFESDSLYQSRHIKFPLTLKYYENTLDTLSTEYISANNFRHFLKLPKTGFSASAKTAAVYKEKINRNKDTVTCIYTATHKEQTLNYTFVFSNGCWYLVDLHDYSLQVSPVIDHFNSKINNY